MSKGFASNYRMVLLATGIFLCFGGIGARLVWLHVLERDDLLKYLEQARRSFLVENARRGNIRAARGEILATSRTLIDVGLDPHMLRPEDEALLQGDKDRHIVGVQDLKIRGVYGNRVYRRFYPQNSLGAHLIGYVNREEVPAAGVEHYMDFFLRGQTGWRESERDGRRRELAQFRSREVPAIDGFDVVLSIDTYVQHLIENELQTIAAEYSPGKATIIVSDARTGFILGLANYPTFNPNEYNKAPIDALRNFAVADVFEPGSTFKIVAASGALNEGLVTPNSAFDCGLTEIDYHNRHLRLPREDHPFHELTVAEIISHSSNRGAAQLAMLLGDQRYYNYVRAFGFGQKTGFPFGGEVEGLLAPPKEWDGLTITRMPMGQSVAATPMQVHYAMAAIA